MTTTNQPTPRLLAQALKRGVSHEAVDEGGWTDLHYAAVLGMTGLTRRLLQRGAPIEAMLATDNKPVSARIVEVLNKLGREFKDWNCDGETPLQLAAWANAAPVVKVLLEHGADVHACTPQKWTALHAAARTDAADAAEVLLAHGADPHQGDVHGRTPINNAAYYNSVEIIEMLLARGVDPNAKCELGFTPLHSATMGDSPGAAARLIDAGVDVNVLGTHRDCTPLDVAETVNTRLVRDFLRRNGGEVTLETQRKLLAVFDRKLGGGWGVAMPIYLKRRVRRNVGDPPRSWEDYDREHGLDGNGGDAGNDNEGNEGNDGNDGEKK